MAWFTALDACCRYQSCPDRTCGGLSHRGPALPAVPPASPVPHLAASPALALHLIQELHLQDHPGVLAWRVREARDDHPSAVHVCEVQPLTGLGTARTLHLAVPHEPTGLPRGPPTPTHARGWAAGEPSVLGPTGDGGAMLPGPHDVLCSGHLLSPCVGLRARLGLAPPQVSGAAVLTRVGRMWGRHRRTALPT